MLIQFNDAPLECQDDCTVGELLSAMNLSQDGSALAINQSILPREQWDQHRLTAGDCILLFQAIAGG